MQGESGSAVEPGLLAAYRAAAYHVLAPSPFMLAIDVPSAALEALHLAHGADCSTYLTACNPASRIATKADNVAATARLRASLEAAGYRWIDAAARDPTGRWPDEPSVLVPRLELGPARTIAMQFGQNALVWAGADAVPRLVVLR